jgi:hypothetical protein
MMDAVIYIRYMQRMCKSHISCNGCELKPGNGKSCMEGMDPQKCISVIEQWAAEHPVKTRQSEILKMFPGAAICEMDGCLTSNPCNFYPKMREECSGRICSDCRREFWLAEVEE